MDFRYSHTFSLLQQEGQLAKRMILSSFDSLLNANITDHQTGNFYSGFFQLSIGCERLLKITTIINHMLENNYKPPTDSELKSLYGHKIIKLFETCTTIHNKFSKSPLQNPASDSCEYKLLDFLNEFAHKSRYYNLDALTKHSQLKDPIAVWWELCQEVLEEEISSSRREKQAMKIMYELDKQGRAGYVWEQNFDGHPMTTFDYHYRIHCFKQSAPHIIWLFIKLFSPLYDTLNYLNERTNEYESKKNIDKPVVPYMYEFFVFLLSDRSRTLRRKKWSSLF